MNQKATHAAPTPMNKTKPILFRAEMVRAILDGRKTQTRREVKPQPTQPESNCHPSHTAKHPAPYLDAYCGEKKTDQNPRGMSANWCWWQVDNRQCLPTFKCPYGAPGDKLWVKENFWRREDDGLMVFAVDGNLTFGEGSAAQRMGIGNIPCPDGVRPDDEMRKLGFVKRSCLFMPRSASRITLEIVSVGVERLNSISKGGALAEGVIPKYAVQCIEAGHGFDAIPRFKAFWESINGKASFDSRWVWKIEFRKI